MLPDQTDPPLVECRAQERTRPDRAVTTRQASVCGLNHIAYPLQVPSQCGQTLARTADALVRAERVGDPALLFPAAYFRYSAAAAAGDIDEVDRCYEIIGSTA